MIDYGFVTDLSGVLTDINPELYTENVIIPRDITILDFGKIFPENCVKNFGNIIIHEDVQIIDPFRILFWKPDIEYLGTETNPYFGLVNLLCDEIDEKCEVIFCFGFSETFSLHIPKNVRRIDSSVTMMMNLNHMTSENGRFTVKDNCLIETETGTLNGVVDNGYKIPDDGSVRILKDEAFFISGSERHVVIPDSVETIGKDCFAFSEIESIKIPKSVKFIGECAFIGMFSLKKVLFPDEKRDMFPDDLKKERIEVIYY